MAASVCTAPAVSKPVSDSIDRFVAEMTPVESDCSSPKGEPMAATGEPTTRRSAGAERQRAQRQPRRVDLQQRDVGEGVEPDDLRRHLVAVLEAHEDLAGGLDRLPFPRVTTWAFVATSPSPSSDEARAEAAPAAGRVGRDDGHDAGDSRR